MEKKNYLIYLTNIDIERHKNAIRVMKLVLNDMSNSVTEWNYFCGLCDNIKIALTGYFNDTDYSLDNLFSIFSDWNCISKDVVYPIKSYTPKYSVSYMYHKAQREYKLYDRSTKYGQARFKLLKHTIKCFEKLIKYNEKLRSGK